MAAWLTQPWAASAEPPLFFESMVNPCYSTPLRADRDGQVDLVGIAEVTVSSSYVHTYRGLALWRLDASGVVAQPYPARLAGTRARSSTRQRPQRR